MIYSSDETNRKLDCVLFQNGHEGKWLSTPYYGGKAAVQLVLQIGTIMAGLTWAPVHMMLSFMGVSVGSTSAFFTNQRIYRDAVGRYFDQEMEAVRRTHGTGGRIVLFDTRYDTPGDNDYSSSFHPSTSSVDRIM